MEMGTRRAGSTCMCLWASDQSTTQCGRRDQERHQRGSAPREDVINVIRRGAACNLRRGGSRVVPRKGSSILRLPAEHVRSPLHTPMGGLSHPHAGYGVVMRLEPAH